MLACEISKTEFTDANLYKHVNQFLKDKLRRIVIPVKNKPAFAGNRIAFVLFNHLTHLAEDVGVEMLDYLIGPYTGRLMAPLATLDLVGLDVHRAIIQNLKEYTSEKANGLELPSYIGAMIKNGFLGNKSSSGFYKIQENRKKAFIDPKSLEYIPSFEPHVRFVERAKQCIHLGKYHEAFNIIREAEGTEAMIVKDIIAKYISHAFSLIGDVTEEKYGIEGIDKVMASGFNWAPPSVIVDLLGGNKGAIDLISEVGNKVPDSLKKGQFTAGCNYDVGRYFTG
jgi:hypothetical protein